MLGFMHSYICACPTSRRRAGRAAADAPVAFSAWAIAYKHCATCLPCHNPPTPSVNVTPGKTFPSTASCTGLPAVPAMPRTRPVAAAARVHVSGRRKL